jgi:hypothetical protein
MRLMKTDHNKWLIYTITLSGFDCMSQVECWQIGQELSFSQVEFAFIDKTKALTFKKSGCHMASWTEFRNAKKLIKHISII